MQQDVPTPIEARAPVSLREPAQLVFVAAVLGAILLLAALIMRIPFAYQIAMTLGIVQGLSEFLPISSSAHLILAPWFLGWPDPGLTFDIALHLGTLVAVLLYFWRDWLALVRFSLRPRTPDGRLFWLLLLGAIPGGITGVLLDEYAETALRSPLLIAGTLALMGVVLLIADRLGGSERELHTIGITDALLIGGGQALAIIPGVSRSGITIAMARMRGIERTAAARFSFLLGSPIIAGAALYKLRHLLELPSAVTGPFVVGVVVAGATGTLAIGLMMRYLQRAGLGIFVLYRLILAAIIVATTVAKW